MSSHPTLAPPRSCDQIDVMVTGACNAGCGFCIQEATYQSASSTDLDFLRSFQRHFRDFHRTGGRKVVITGGEPLLSMGRVLGVLRELSRYTDLRLKALYTNGTFLARPARGTEGLTCAEALAQGELGCVNLSVHHYDDEVNRRILRVREQPGSRLVIRHAMNSGLPVRLNLTLQRSGINSFDSLRRYLEWAFSQGVVDVYVRELFRYAVTRARPVSDRDPISYGAIERVDVRPLVQKMSEDRDFDLVGQSYGAFREKVEFSFRYRPSGRMVYVSSLSVGNEDEGGGAYLVLMPDGQLYRGWYGEPDRIPRVGGQGLVQLQAQGPRGRSAAARPLSLSEDRATEPAVR